MGFTGRSTLNDASHLLLIYRNHNQTSYYNLTNKLHTINTKKLEMGENSAWRFTKWIFSLPFLVYTPG